jgi:glutaredoxin 3
MEHFEMADQTKPQPRVIVFSTPTCGFCNQAKRYFRDKGIKFKDIDVSKDATAARDMVRRSGQQGVPVIDIGGKIVIGFDRPKINSLLGIH